MCLYQPKASSASALTVGFLGSRSHTAALNSSCSLLVSSFLFDVLFSAWAVGQCQSPLCPA